jgi:hypothetical protein
MEVQPLSYNQYVEQYGGGFPEFSIHCLAYLLQQRRHELTPETIREYEADLVGTRYEIVVE